MSQNHLQCLQHSVVLRMSCFETLVDYSKAEDVISGTFVTGKNLLLQFSLAHKRSLPLSREGSVKAKNCGLADSSAATVAVTPAQNGNPNFYGFNLPPTSKACIPSMEKLFFPLTCRIPSIFFVTKVFGVRFIFSIQSVQMMGSHPWC